MTNICIITLVFIIFITVKYENKFKQLTAILMKISIEL